MYRVIADDLRKQIETGALEAGRQVPTEAELQLTYSASRNTVREALKWLSALGLLETRPGHGTFVKAQLIPIINTIGPNPAGEVTGHTPWAAGQGRITFSTPLVKIQGADSQLAGALQLPAGSQIISRQRSGYVDDLPWSVQTTFYPMELVERGAARLLSTAGIDTGTLSYLYDTLHIRMETWRASLSCRPAHEAEAEFFQLPHGAVVEIAQTCYEESSVPLCFTVMVYPSDRNLFQVIAGIVPPVVS